MRLKILILASTILASGFTGAQILPAMDGYTVDVTFSKELQQRLASVDSLERKLEAKFRDDRNDREGPRQPTTQRFAANETAGTEWAGERLIGDLEHFTVENLVKAMVAYNVNRAAPGFEGHIRVELRKLGLTNTPIAAIERVRSYAAGRVTVALPDGSVLFDDRVSANLVVNPTADRSYTGPALAFIETEPHKRVGPTLAYFVERALERAWPQREGEIVGPVVVRVSDANERVVLGDF